MMSNKIPYPILALQVEILYQKQFANNDLKAIEDHCQYIAEVIKAMGWSEEEYIERWMQEQDQDN
jgi:hypothetical protein